MNSRLVLTISVFMRLGAGLLLLIGLARFLEQAELGALTLALAAGGMISVVQDFGQPTFMLRRIGIWPAWAPRVTFRALLVKALLTVLLAIPVIAGVYWIAGSRYAPPVGIIVVAACISGFAEIFSGSLRALGKYGREFFVSWAASIPYLVLPIAVATQTTDFLTLAVAILAARVIHLIAAITASAPVLHYHRWRPSWGRRIATTLRASVPFASESVLINGSNQIDVFLLGAMLPLADFGTYQAGSRFTQAAAPLANILMTSNLPRTSSAIHRSASVASATRRVFVEFLLAGALLGGALYLLGPVIAQHLYLGRFPGLDQLWAGLAGATLLRFVAAAYNLLLTARGQPHLPAYARASYSIVLVLALIMIIPQYGLSGVAASLIVAASALLVVSAGQYLVISHEWRLSMGVALPVLILGNMPLISSLF